MTDFLEEETESNSVLEAKVKDLEKELLIFKIKDRFNELANLVKDKKPLLPKSRLADEIELLINNLKEQSRTYEEFEMIFHFREQIKPYREIVLKERNKKYEYSFFDKVSLWLNYVGTF